MRDDRRRFDSGCLERDSEDALRQLLHLRLTVCGRRERHRDSPRRLVPDGAVEAGDEAAEEETGGRHEDRAHRHLSRHQRPAAQSSTPPAHLRRRVDARSPIGGHDRGRDDGEKRHAAEQREEGPVEREGQPIEGHPAR